VRDDVQRALVEDARGELVEDVALLADDDRVARVGAALVADDDVTLGREEVDDATLPLVPPLHPEHAGHRHGRTVLRLTTEGTKERAQRERRNGRETAAKTARRRSESARPTVTGRFARVHPCGWTSGRGHGAPFPGASPA